MNGEAALSITEATSKVTEAPPEKPPLKQKKPREIKESSEAFNKDAEGDSLFFPLLLATKNNLTERRGQLVSQI